MLLPAVEQNDQLVPLLWFLAVTEPGFGPPQRHQTRQEVEGPGCSQEQAERLRGH